MYYLYILLDLVLYKLYISESACTNKKCESKNNEFKLCKINKLPQNSYIISMDIRQSYSSGRCRFSITYGFNTTKIWVDKGCRAKFVICYSVQSKYTG